MHRMGFILTAIAATTLSACASKPVAPVVVAPAARPDAPLVPQAQALLASASGSLVSGKLLLLPEAGGVRLRGEIGGLTPGGRAGFHVHERGDCSSVDASSAGAHFNPTGQPHGNARTGPHHLGDLDNLIVDLEGVARVDVRVPGLTLGGPVASNIIGRALVVHAAPDDYLSQPAGNAGARVACAVIRPLATTPAAAVRPATP